LLTWQGIPAVVVAVVAVWMLVVSVLTIAANRAAVAGDYATAVGRYRSVATLNPWLEQWRVHYNLGTAQLLDDQLDAAVGQLEEALKTAPAAGMVQAEDADGNAVTVRDPNAPECLVRVNLYVTHMSLASAAEEAGDTATVEAEQDAATQAAGECEVPPPPEPQPDPSSTPSDPPTSTPTPEPTSTGGGSTSPTPEPTATGQSSGEATPESSASPSPSPTPTDAKRRSLEDRNGDANATPGTGINGGDGRKW
ncbi:hypothetical protein, partial [Actinomyces sp. MRS3W]|uniref:hypothetical protein n=1 Tax=Actinomyces sp. MRS3W TaxID=2800796 RepID=UPI0028FD245F